jgi:tRNA modification GTPase
MWSAHELIVAPATVPGPGARAIVRMAGEGLDRVLRALLAAESPGWPAAGEQPRVVRATLAAQGLGREWGELSIDVLVWPGPGGPIGGPLAELQLPASPHLVDAVVVEACRLGARLARGGEFTLRAFLAGRLDLVQAEAVLGVVDALTPAELSAALDRMAGGAGRALAAVRDELLDLLADVEASIDFADEATPDAVPVAPVWHEIARRLDDCRESIDRVSAALAARDSAATDLPRVALVGPPNIGKSSLFNALAGRDAALVADEPGTTRDWLEARITATPGGDHVLVDLAGLDAACDRRDEIGAAAQAAAVAEIRRADVVVLCRDAGTALAPPPADHPGIRIDVITRCDRGSAAAPVSAAIATSAHTGAGIDRLRDAIRGAVVSLPPRGSPATVRMAVGASAASTAIDATMARARAAAAGAAIDEAVVAASIRTAVESLADVTGAAIGTELLDRIFSRHCIGK